MRARDRLLWVLVLTVTSWLSLVPAASAYIDPGSTSLIFQALVAVAAAVGMTLKVTWHRLRRLFTRGDPDRGNGSVTADET